MSEPPRGPIGIAHQKAASVAGEMSFAIVRREADDDTRASWARRLRQAADLIDPRRLP
jgi:hypothetical protein